MPDLGCKAQPLLIVGDGDTAPDYEKHGLFQGAEMCEDMIQVTLSLIDLVHRWTDEMTG